jgi:hypothetical protein
MTHNKTLKEDAISADESCLMYEIKTKQNW